MQNTFSSLVTKARLGAFSGFASKASDFVSSRRSCRAAVRGAVAFGRLHSFKFTIWRWPDLLWLFGAVAYCIIPRDLIPDNISVFGILDDVTTVGYACVRFGPMLTYLKSERERGRFVARGIGPRHPGGPVRISRGFRRYRDGALGGEVPVGAVLAIPVAHYAERTGIYLGDGRVVEAYRDQGMGIVRATDLSSFAGKSGRVYVACSKGKGPPRPLADPSVAQAAQRHLDERFRFRYYGLRSNSSMFTASCVMGKPLVVAEGVRSGRVGRALWRLAAAEAALLCGTFAFGELTLAVSRKMNRGKGVRWCSLSIKARS